MNISDEQLPDDEGRFKGSAERARDGRKVRLLIVDDELSILGRMVQILQDAGYFVQPATDGREGLDWVRKAAWDLVVTDLSMPEMDGEELAREIRTISPGTPIVLITGMVSTVTRPELFDAVLAKPFKMPDLRAAIEQLGAHANPHVDISTP